MSPKQTQLYWRLWGQVCETQHWRMSKGRLVSSLPLPTGEGQGEGQCVPNPQPAIRNPQLDTVLRIASNLATSKHRATTPEDLRHASHFVAAGRDCSSTALTNPEIDRLFNLWKLLIDDTNLDAAIALENPEIGERKRIIHKIKTAAPDSYIDTICRDQFRSYNSPFWEDLPITDLRNLARTISARTNRWTRPIRPVASDVSPIKLDPLPEPITTPF